MAGALLTAAEAAGTAAACLDTIVDYLNTRKQFGRLIGSFQALKHRAAEMFALARDPHDRHRSLR